MGWTGEQTTQEGSEHRAEDGGVTFSGTSGRRVLRGPGRAIWEEGTPAAKGLRAREWRQAAEHVSRLGAEGAGRPRAGLEVESGPPARLSNRGGRARLRGLSRPRDGTKGGTAPLRSRTASQSIDPAGSHLAATASAQEGMVRGPGPAVS